MSKKVKKLVKLAIEAGKANPAPPVGPALGAAGANIQDFCKQFNDRTKDQKGPIPVVITVYEDRSFDFITKIAPMGYLLMEAAGIKKGSSTVGTAISGRIKMAKVREVAEKKLPDLNTRDLEAAVRMAVGSARSMGLEVVE